jgi:antitoxin component of RelBE/YafQ-DinJ toxin-antitoxin module
MAKVILYVQLDDHVKARIMRQCERLGLTQAGLTKQALVKFLEEEEKVQEDNARRRK